MEGKLPGVTRAGNERRRQKKRKGKEGKQGEKQETGVTRQGKELVKGFRVCLVVERQRL